LIGWIRCISGEYAVLVGNEYLPHLGIRLFLS